MKDLETLLKEAKLYGESDITIIKRYLTQKELIGEAPQLLTDILQSEINNYIRLRNNQITWGTLPWDDYYKNYPENIAPRLVSLTLKNIAGLELSENDIEWLKENAPKTKLKAFFFQPLLEQIHKAGIRFKGDTE